jgi:AP-1 complex subunit beta-1
LLTGINEKKDKVNFKLPSYAAQELMVSIMDIFRTYPDKYEGVIGNLCEAIQTYDDPNAKASLIWILGEYCTRIEVVEEIFMDLMNINLEQQNLDTFMEDTVAIQLASINTVTKMFIGVPNDATQLLFTTLLNKAMTECLSPDVRMKAAFYFRLAQMDSSRQMLSSIVFVQKPAPIFGDGLSSKLQDQLSSQLGSIPATLRELVVQKQVNNIEAEDIVKQFDGMEYE